MAKTKDREQIEFTCAVAKVMTMTDGGVRVWLDLPEGSLEALAKLAACQSAGVYLSAALVPTETD